MNEEDLRVLRTRRLLKEALTTLIHEQGYETLTIRDITSKAQIGYKTFFRHYESKDALLQASVSDVVDTLKQGLLKPTEPDAPIRNTQRAIQFALDNKTVFLAVYRSPAADQLMQPLIQLMHQEGQHFSKDTAIPDAFVAHHFGSSLMALIVWWLEHNQPFSADKLLSFLDQLLLSPLAHLGTPQ